MMIVIDNIKKTYGAQQSLQTPQRAAASQERNFT